MKSKIISVACLSFGLCLPAYSAIIDHADYLTDTDSGLDWLDVTTTTGRTYYDIAGQLAEGGSLFGWRYATGDEFNALISNYTGTSINTYDSVNHGDNKIDGLVVLLGSTLDLYHNFGISTWDSMYGYQEGEGYDYTYGILADNYLPSLTWDGLPVHYLAGIFDYDASAEPSDSTHAHREFFHKNTLRYDVGSYLVRDTAYVQVSEPNVIALMALGIWGIFTSRVRNRRLSTTKI